MELPGSIHDLSEGREEEGNVHHKPVRFTVLKCRNIQADQNSLKRVL